MWVNTDSAFITSREREPAGMARPSRANT
jgi:hypothetical protein